MRGRDAAGNGNGLRFTVSFDETELPAMLAFPTPSSKRFRCEAGRTSHRKRVVRHAFVVTDIEQRLLGMSSEQCGYHFSRWPKRLPRGWNGVAVAGYGGEGELPYRSIVASHCRRGRG